jgi:hypothetical protein
MQINKDNIVDVLEEYNPNSYTVSVDENSRGQVIVDFQLCDDGSVHRVSGIKTAEYDELSLLVTDAMEKFGESAGEALTKILLDWSEKLTGGFY